MEIIDKRKLKELDGYKVGQLVSNCDRFCLVVELYNQNYALIDVKSGAAISECTNNLTELWVRYGNFGDQVVNAKLVIEEGNGDED